MLSIFIGTKEEKVLYYVRSGCVPTRPYSRLVSLHGVGQVRLSLPGSWGYAGKDILVHQSFESQNRLTNLSHVAILYS